MSSLSKDGRECDVFRGLQVSYPTEIYRNVPRLASCDNIVTILLLDPKEQNWTTHSGTNKPNTEGIVIRSSSQSREMANF